MKHPKTDFRAPFSSKGMKIQTNALEGGKVLHVMCKDSLLNEYVMSVNIMQFYNC
jgi:hypothetical protein